MKMNKLEQLKQDIEMLSSKANNTMLSIAENNSTDKHRKNIQRGKLLAYDHVISLINKLL